MSKSQSKVRTSRWFVITVAPHAEYRARSALLQAGFGPYLPERKVERFNHRLKVWRELIEVIIPGYMLVEFPVIPDTEWYERNRRPTWRSLRSCEGVIAALGIPDPDGVVQPLAVGSAIIERLIAAQANMVFDDTRAARKWRGETKESALNDLQKKLVGEKVLVNNGPFATFPAVVDTVTSLERVQVLIEIFGRMTPVTLEPRQVDVLAG